MGMLLTMGIAGCSGSAGFDHAAAVQSHYANGVPHVTDDGAISQVVIAGQSHVQRVLYHALAGRFHGLEYDLAPVAEAGYTAVHPWEGQDQAEFLDQARQAGLGTVPHYPEDAIAARADDYGVLAWYLDEEPTLRFPAEEQESLRDAFRQRRAALRAIDPGRPVFALLGPPLARLRPQWDFWATEGDLSVHDNYTVHERLAEFTTPARHVARSVSIARDLVPPDRPIWFVIQAFASEARGWTMPTAQEYRAMAMAALIHGASGIVTFALDSFVTRDDDVLGISPVPAAGYGADLPDYNGDGKPHRTASEAERALSAGLWRDVASFNHYLARIEPVLLRPDRAAILSVAAAPVKGLANPVRATVKEVDGHYHVFAVNLLAEPVEAEFRMQDGATVALESNWPYGPQRRWYATGGVWRDKFEALGVRVYRIGDE